MPKNGFDEVDFARELGEGPAEDGNSALEDLDHRVQVRVSGSGVHLEDHRVTSSVSGGSNGFGNHASVFSQSLKASRGCFHSIQTFGVGFDLNKLAEVSITNVKKAPFLHVSVNLSESVIEGGANQVCPNSGMGAKVPEGIGDRNGRVDAVQM
jgi:hypothetical protein